MAKESMNLKIKIESNNNNCTNGYIFIYFQRSNNKIQCTTEISIPLHVTVNTFF